MAPPRTILFAADFSENSVEAFRLACSLAWPGDTLVIVHHVIESDRDAELQSSPSVEALGAARESRMREVYVPARPIEVAYRTSEGPAAAEILRTADEIGADLIALGTHGRTGLRRLLAGSVAESVLREARCSVVALHSHGGRPLPERIRVILHPIALSDDNDYTLRASCALAASLGARLVVIHVSPRGVLMDGSLSPQIKPEYYRHFLDSVRKEGEASELSDPADLRLSWGNIVDGILSEAKDVGCDLIVMGTHWWSWPCRRLMGSVSESVLHAADYPVLLIKAPRREHSILQKPAADELAMTSDDPPAVSAK
jgi:nucleotide-binding universal stress UspA family protein